MLTGVAFFDFGRYVEREKGGITAQIETIRTNTSAGWVSISPVLVVNNISDPHVRRDVFWTMDDSALAGAVQKAHSMGLKVLLKPHLQLDCAWDTPSGKATCATNTSCNIWWSSHGTPCYRDYVGCNQHPHTNGPKGPGGPPFSKGDWNKFMEAWGSAMEQYARQIVAPLGVEAFAIATELSCPTTEPFNEAAWRSLLRRLKALAPSTQLTIGLHDKDMMTGGQTPGAPPFLDAAELTFLGFDAYHAFSTLRAVDMPTPYQWATAWAARGQQTNPNHDPLPCTSPLEWYASVALRYNKSLVFTEFGFYSVMHCASIAVGTGFGPQLRPSEPCMVSAFEAVWNVFSRAPWWRGAFWWDWNGRGYAPTDLSIDGKLLLQGSMRRVWDQLSPVGLGNTTFMWPKESVVVNSTQPSLVVGDGVDSTAPLPHKARESWHSDDITQLGGAEHFCDPHADPPERCPGNLRCPVCGSHNCSCNPICNTSKPVQKQCPGDSGYGEPCPCPDPKSCYCPVYCDPDPGNQYCPNGILCPDCRSDCCACAGMPPGLRG